MKLTLLFYCYEYSINRDTGQVDEHSTIHACVLTEDEARGLEDPLRHIGGAVELCRQEVEYTPPTPKALAIITIDMLKKSKAQIREESLRKLESIEDKLQTYLAIQYAPEA